MMNAQLPPGSSKAGSIDIHFDGPFSKGFAIALDFLFRRITTTAKVTAQALTAGFRFPDLVLVGTLPTFWTFHTAYFTYSFRHSRKCRDVLCEVDNGRIKPS